MRVSFLVSTVAMSAALAGCAGFTTPADTEADATIRATLERWRQDFNARRSERICDLFAPELRADFQGVPELNHAKVCGRLKGALADPADNTTLALHIKELIVSGPMAMVRLTWTATVVTPDGRRQTDEELGLDVFARQADGAWKIVRYIAYPQRRE